jgi:NAD/NADP transhydrogenase beta subunit
MFFIAKEIQTAAYLFASILFILSLGGLSSQESAKRGVMFGIVGMIVAIIATVLGEGVARSCLYYCCHCHCFCNWY